MPGRIKKGVKIVLSLFFLSYILCIPAEAETKVYRQVETDRKQIALTFDDGPHPRLTPEILAILEQYHTPATFFMIGVNVNQYPQTAREVIAAGHEVGNHTYTHSHISRLNESTLETELEKCEDVLEELCEYRPHLFRPPEGAVTSYVEHCSERGDYTMILWSIDTHDWAHRSAADIVDTVLSQVRPGSIILMHDYIGTDSHTAEALSVFLPELLRRGYEPVTVSRLLGQQ